MVGIPFESGHIDLGWVKAAAALSKGERIIVAFAVALFNGWLGMEVAEQFGLDDGLVPSMAWSLDDEELLAALELMRMLRGL